MRNETQCVQSFRKEKNHRNNSNSIRSSWVWPSILLHLPVRKIKDRVEHGNKQLWWDNKKRMRQSLTLITSSTPQRAIQEGLENMSFLKYAVRIRVLLWALLKNANMGHTLVPHWKMFLNWYKYQPKWFDLSFKNHRKDMTTCLDTPWLTVFATLQAGT